MTFVLLLGLIAANQTTPDALYNQGVDAFQKGRVAESLVAFDKLVAMAPNAEAQLWQRGISQLLLGKYKECKAQFELHRTVNPDDVENAAYHFFCTAGAESSEAAKAKLLPVGPDSRVPMKEVYRMLKGELQPDDVIRAAGRNPGGLFYANLYVGLYMNAMGQPGRAIPYLREASAERYRGAGYMHDAARIHLRQLEGSRP